MTMLHYFQAVSSRLPVLPPTLPGGIPWPKISIITPSYNQGKYIESTILSVLGQKYPNVEHIIVDACSTDTTSSVLKKYKTKLAKVIQEPDKGQSDAINKGMRYATGDILTWLNSDDMLAPGSLAAIAMGFHLSGADIVAGMCQVFNNGAYSYSHLTSCADGLLSAEEISDLNGYWLQGKFFYQPEAMFTRNVWERSGGYIREDLHWCMDVEMWLRFASHDATIHVINTPVAMFRVHKEQKTSDTQASPKEYVHVANEWRTANGFSPLPTGVARYHEKRPLRVRVNNTVPPDHQPAQETITRVISSLRASGVTCVSSEDEAHDISFQFSPTGALTASTSADGEKRMSTPPCAEDFLFFPGAHRKTQQHPHTPEHPFITALYVARLRQDLDADSLERRLAVSGIKVIRFGDEHLSSDATRTRAELFTSVDCFIYAGTAENADSQFLAEAVLSGVPSIALVDEAASIRLAKHFPWVHYTTLAPEEWIDTLPTIGNTLHDMTIWSNIYARSYLSPTALWRTIYLQMEKEFALGDKLQKNLTYRGPQIHENTVAMRSCFQKNKEAIKSFLPTPVWNILRKIQMFLINNNLTTRR